MVERSTTGRTARYDPLATNYDAHFDRPVDRWEDEWLAGLLAPFVNGRRVMDLGCGTGWLLDHLSPASYVGVDSSADMLTQLVVKHPKADARLLVVGAEHWADELPEVDAVVATWAADYLLTPASTVLADCHALTAPGGAIALHGYQPRGHRRRHCVERAFLGPNGPLGDWSPDSVARAQRTAELVDPTITGTGCLPDALARWEWLWRATLRLPWRWHYGALYVWRV